MLATYSQMIVQYIASSYMYMTSISRKAETLCMENETYCHNVIILKHLQQAAQTHTKQHIFIRC